MPVSPPRLPTLRRPLPHTVHPCFRPRLTHLLLLAIGAIYGLLFRMGVRTGVVSRCNLLEGTYCADSSSEADSRVGGLAVVAVEGQQQRRQQQESKGADKGSVKGEEQGQQQLKGHQGERLLFMLSSYDRGERLSGSWEKGKDKLPVILRVVDLARGLCEAGYDVTVAFISAWPASQQPEAKSQIEDHLRCDRINRGAAPLPVWWCDQYNASSIGGKLAFQHRFLLKKELRNFDFFIQVEDDTGLTAQQVGRYRHHVDFLRGLNDPRVTQRFLPGFIRYETDDGGNKFFWEGTAEQFDVERLGGVWYAKTTSFINQAGWMGSREQVLEWNNTICKEPFLDGWGPGWVEFFSGGIQLYQECHRKKLLPLDEFDLFLSPHLANNKLYHRGRGVTPTEEVKRRLQRLRAACEAMGVADSMLLPREQWVTEEEQGEIDRATAALDKEKRDDADREEGEGVVEEARRRGSLKGRRGR